MFGMLECADNIPQKTINKTNYYQTYDSMKIILCDTMKSPIIIIDLGIDPGFQ